MKRISRTEKEIAVNVKKVAVVVVGSLIAFAIAAAPKSRSVEVQVAAQPTPYSADHARIQGEPAPLPAQF
jgi:hypothetical protein